MLIDGRHLNTSQRRDLGPKPFDPEKMQIGLKYDKDSQMYTLRIDDKNNPEFWITVMISESELNEIRDK